MLLKDLPKEFRCKHIFRYSYGLVKYQCRATYPPFGIREVAKYDRMKLEEICTPLMHLEREAKNTGKSTYRSHLLCYIH
jgi:hypothetical protein